MYSRDLVDSVLKQADIVTVISSYIPVIKKGRSYVAVCPFHDDKNPSLNISKEKQIFKCFACNTGGNAITFVQKHEGISFDEAVRKVADLIGFHDGRLLSDAYKPKVNKELQPLYDTINDLESFYQYGLSIQEGVFANEYLKKRGIDDKQIKKYGVGYAISSGDKTVEYLEKKGHPLDQIKDIGIVSARSNSDSNAGRLIFPLHDQNGQVVGFSARKINPNDHDSPKYVNSPDTKIFKKSLNLYNYHNAKNTAKHDGYCYVLEGFMDVLALDKAGINSAVALMGTSLSKEQISLLRKLNSEIRLCLDGDAAGQKGMMKMIMQLNQAGLPFRLVCNPNDLRDPDDILQESGVEVLKSRMGNLVDPFDFQVNYYMNVEKLSKPEDRKKVMMYFIPYLRSMNPGIEQEDYIVKLSKATGYEAEAIRNQMLKATSDAMTVEEISYQDEVNFERLHSNEVASRKLMKAEKAMLYYMMQKIDAVKFFQKNIDNFYYGEYEKLASYIVEYVDRENKEVEISSLINDIAASNDEDEADLISLASRLVSENVNYPPFSAKEIESCRKTIYEEKTKIFDGKATKKKLLEKDGDPGAILKAYADRRLKETTNKK